MSRWLSVRSWFDRPVAAILHLVLFPLLVVVAAAVRLVDGGPTVIRVPRVGRGRVPFGMLKVRTMTATEASGLSDGIGLSGPGDARITSVGRCLRRRRLDELPQLVNVARGEMSLIGPRPEAPEFVEAGSAAWGHVLKARPGIVGPTQIMVHGWEADLLNGRSAERDYRDVVLPVKLAIDTWYVDHASPWIDLLVVAAVVQLVIGGGREPALTARIRRSVPEAIAVPAGGARS